jgi:hypothetical protein
MSPRPPPLESDLDELLEAERRAPEPGDALARVWSRVAPPGTTAAKPDVPTASAPKVVSALGPHGVTLVVAAVVAAAGAGAGLHALFRPVPPARVVFVDPPMAVKAPVVVASPVVEGAASDGERQPIVPRPVRSAPARLAPVPVTPSLSEERALLDEARDALSQGEGERALTLTDEYARRFARPQLGEEREALAIQALVLAGRYVEARDRAARFEAVSPRSLFRPAVEASLSSIP